MQGRSKRTQIPMALIQVALRQQFTTTKSIKPYLSLPPPCNKSHLHEANTKKLAPALFLSKNWGKEKKFQRKCVTLWGRLTASTN